MRRLSLAAWPVRKARSKSTDSRPDRRRHVRRLQSEPLEDRRLLATVTVSTDSDVVDFGGPQMIANLPGADGVISLREAILAANNTAGSDTIGFDASFNAAKTIALTGGQLDITTSLAIIGPGADLLTISGNNASRVFNVDDSNAIVQTVSLSGMTIVGGNTSLPGGGINNRENLTIDRATISGNTSTATGFTGGGGIYTRGAILDLRNSTVAGNHTTNSEGGGIRARFGGSLLVSNSTISANTALTVGGGISASDGGVNVTVANSTIAANTGSFAALFIFDSSLDVDNSIIADNVKTSTTTSDFADFDFGGPPSTRTFDFCLVESGEPITGTGNITGVDPLLGPLATNGGPTLTHALLPDSPAINAGDPNILPNPAEFDQRGAPFRRVSSNRLDIGAFESRSLSNPGFEADGGSLRGWTSFPVAEVSLSTAAGFGSDHSAELRGNTTAGFAVLYQGVSVRPGSLVTASVRALVDSQLPAGASGDLKIEFYEVFNGNFGVPGEYLGQVSTTTVTTASTPGTVIPIELTALAPAGAVEARVTLTYNGNTGAVRYDDVTFRQTLVVDTTEDVNDGDLTPGDLSLREAIELANGTSGADTITFSSLFDTTQTITIDSQLPTITDDLILTGPGATRLTIDAGGGLDGMIGNGDGFRVLEIDDGSATSQIHVEISGVTLTGGDQIGDNVGGGAILNREDLTLSSSRLVSNASTQFGGAIDNSTNSGNSASLMVVDSEISENVAGWGGGISNGGSGTTTIRDSVLSGNTGSFIGGGAIYSFGGMLLVTDSELLDNVGGLRGGGIFVRGEAHITDSIISGNSAGDGGGILNRGTITTLSQSTISGNSAGSDGGGIFNDGTITTLSQSTISGNSAFIAGNGIYNVGTITTLSQSTISGNSAGYLGGGIFNVGTITTLSQSTISDNSATSNGGGIYNAYYGTITTLSLSTISGNSAFRGGGIYNAYYGTITTLSQSTISGNSAGADGGGIYNRGTIVITGTIVANSTGEDVFVGSGSDLTGSFNLVEDDTGGLSNTISGDPMLGPLDNNGGPTMTHALLPGSPAIDAGDPNAVAGMAGIPTYDQRGMTFGRVVAIASTTAAIDIGAYEVQSAPNALIVDTTMDELDTDFSPGHLSLREAIGWANTFQGNNIITFDGTVFATSRTITLTGGELHISDAVSIDATMVNNNVTIDADGASRVLRIDDGDSSGAIAVSLAGLTLTDGDVTTGSPTGDAGFGGGIFSLEDLTITDSVITGNRASSQGGGIQSGSQFTSSTGTNLTLINSTISNNTAGFGGTGNGRGGGISIHTSTASITDSTISGNSAGNDGGGIHNLRGTITTLSQSTISGNSASGNGGGIFNSLATITTLSQSTISGNSASGNGGGIYNLNTITTLSQSTISGNSAGNKGGGIFNPGMITTLTQSTISGNSAGDSGGGIYNRGTIDITGTIVANSTGEDVFVGSGSDLTGSFNLVEDDTGGLSNTISGDPMLGPLDNNGGPTMTHALLPGSPAIDAGDPNAVAGMAGIPTYDQRGMTFGRVVAIASTTAAIDIGAYEVQSAPNALIVDTTMDELDTDFSPGHLSLREAIGWANTFRGNNIITFDGTVFATSRTITLTGGELHISDAVSIDATSVNNHVTIDADGLSRVLRIDDGDSSGAIAVSLAGLTLTGGDVTGFGGGIFSLEDLTITDSVITGNRASSRGGGIQSGRSNYTTSTGTNLTLINSTISNNTADMSGPPGGRGGGMYIGNGMASITGSTISGNSATSKGGGIYNADYGTITTLSLSTISGNSAFRGGGIYNAYYGTITTLSQSTISGNSASSEGGGIYNVGTITTLSQSTISGNSAGYFGGGIYNDGTITTLSQSTISGNSAGYSGGGIYNDGTIVITGTIVANSTGEDVFVGSGSDLTGSFNLVEDDTGGLSNTISGDPMLGPLDNNGGPTLTHALLPGSPAIDAGDPNAVAGMAGIPTYDQRGMTFGRVVAIASTTAAIDIGAYEVQSAPNALIVDTTMDELDTDFSPGHLSLREAIGWANTFRGNNIITFDGTVFATSRTITLTGGELHISDAVSIDATSVNNHVTIDADGLSRVLRIDDGDSSGAIAVSLAGLTLTGGDVTGFGGGIFSLEDLTITDSVITGNRASSRGGGIQSGRSNYTTSTGTNLTLINSTISNNTADMSGPPGGRGGGMYIGNGMASITGSTISGNSATSKGGGIFNADYGTITTLSLSTISGNSAFRGGGIYNAFYGTITTLSQSTISGNSASSEGGGIYNVGTITTLSQSTISGNSAGYFGGGIYNDGTITTLSQSTISGNSAGYFGGGIYNDGTITTLSQSTISGNSAAMAGGGIANFLTAAVTDSTIFGNSAGGDGGGIFNWGMATVTNSTISGNSAGGAGGGLNLGGSSGMAAVSNSTIFGNSAVSGGGIFNDSSSTMNNTIVAGSVSGADIVGGLLGAFNLIQDGSGVGLTNTVIGDPLLGLLANNGGPTLTHALLAGSPAIDAGDPTFSPPPDFDQRGAPFVRFFDDPSAPGGGIDIGAFELQTTPSVDPDFNNDGFINGVDIDLLQANIVTGPADPGTFRSDGRRPGHGGRPQ